MEKDGLNNLRTRSSNFCEMSGCLKKGSRVLKAEEAWEHLKLTTETEEEVGVI